MRIKLILIFISFLLFTSCSSEFLEKDCRNRGGIVREKMNVCIGVDCNITNENECLMNSEEFLGEIKDTDSVCCKKYE